MKILSILLCLFFLTGCAAGDATSEPTEDPDSFVTEAFVMQPTMPTAPTVPPDPIRELINQMSLEERVGQLFLARCNADTALSDIVTYRLGGFVLFGADFQNETKTSLIEKINHYQTTAKIPLFIAVDEEGGSVTRISQYPAFRESKFSSIRQLYDGGGIDWILSVEQEKCLLLKALGVNVNLGPVCDITTDPNAFMYRRSLGQDAQTTANVIAQMVMQMDRYQIGSSLKHFPGYGNNTDTHIGIATDSRSLEELQAQDLIPFAAGIDAGCTSILVSHTIIEALDAELPASLSPSVHRYLREEMGFQGVILTDDLVMQAITDRYGAGEAAVMAVLAGNDMLCSTEYAVQYEAVLDAVLDGRIDIDTLNSAVRNVLEWKQKLGLI